LARPIREEMKQNREKLRAAEKMNASESEIQRLSGEQGRLMGKFIAIHTQASAKFYRLLKPEQRVKDDQMHEQMRQRMRSNNPRTHSDE
jgi:LTXXQ motif family protein